MARQTYKQLKVPPEARVSLAQLFINNSINPPAGEVSFGDQTNLPSTFRQYNTNGQGTGRGLHFSILRGFRRGVLGKSVTVM